MERLQKVIANYGYSSRRKAEELIKEGRVSVNGKLITDMGVKVSGTDIISIDGATINKDVAKEYYLLNKPRNVISSVSDDKDRKTVTDLIKSNNRVYPIGRLDYDTTGVILLTNDGDLANLLMHPSFEIEKTYMVKVEGLLDKEDIIKLKKGVKVDNRLVKIVNFKIRKKDLTKCTTMIEITIIEGRNHIVKRLFEEMGYYVMKLSRIKYAFLTLDDLKSGEYRTLSIKEVKRLYSLKK